LWLRGILRLKCVEPLLQRVELSSPGIRLLELPCSELLLLNGIELSLHHHDLLLLERKQLLQLRLPGRELLLHQRRKLTLGRKELTLRKGLELILLRRLKLVLLAATAASHAALSPL
jgi:hypothetical protein